MNIEFKHGVKLTITNAIDEIMHRVCAVYTLFNVPCVITSGSDGQHSEKSKHYSDEALDFRIRDIQPDRLGALTKAIKEALGKDFDVVLEHTHLHVEYDPKG